MTQQRLAQLRGCLANLRDSTDDYRAAVLAQDGVRRCCEYAGLVEYFAMRAAPADEGDVRVGESLCRELVQLADALGIALSGALEEKNAKDN